LQLHVIWSSGLIVYFISLFDQVSSFRSSEFLLIFLSFSYILSIAKKLCLIFCLHILEDFFLSVVSFISCPFCVFVFLSVRTLSVLVSAYADYVLFDGLFEHTEVFCFCSTNVTARLFLVCFIFDVMSNSSSVERKNTET
jgi:hypothetical protein